MKKRLSVILLSIMLIIFSFFVLSACGKYDYYVHVTDERSDLFCAETEEFFLTVSCVYREHPFLADGAVSPRAKTVEAVLTEKTPSGGEYEIYFLDDVSRGGEMSFRNVSGDYFYSRGVEEFPQGTLSLRIVKDGTSQEIAATSVKNENTLSTREALEKAVASEPEYIGRLTVDGKFHGEFYVRLLRRDKNYYYVGIVGKDGVILSLLLDSETGETLARRESELH